MPLCVGDDTRENSRREPPLVAADSLPQLIFGFDADSLRHENFCSVDADSFRHKRHLCGVGADSLRHKRHPCDFGANRLCHERHQQFADCIDCVPLHSKRSKTPSLKMTNSGMINQMPGEFRFLTPSFPGQWHQSQASLLPRRTIYPLESYPKMLTKHGVASLKIHRYQVNQT